MSHEQALLEVTALTKRYGEQTVVGGLSLTLPAGRCLTLLGPNGAGKTTTLRCLLGFTAFESGEIRLAGLPVPERAREARASVGVVPQADNLDPDFTCTENLLVYARYFGLSRREARARVPELLAFAGLAHKADTLVPDLSGGMKRRLTLARALIHRPRLLVLDEPTTGLDPQARHLIWERLRQLLREGIAILLTTHFMEEAERLADDIVIMDRGRKIAEGTPHELIAREIEPNVVELYAGRDEAAFAALVTRLRPLFSRMERSGETVFGYCHDPAPVLAALEGNPQRYLLRPANLEDVFLKLTGREQREE